MAVNPDTTVRKIVSLPKELWEEVSDYRFDNRLGTEADALRRLIQLGLDAAKASPRDPGRAPSRKR